MGRNFTKSLQVTVKDLHDLEIIDKFCPERVEILGYGKSVIPAIYDLRSTTHIRCVMHEDYRFSGYCCQDMSDDLDVVVDGDVLYITNTTHIPWSSILIAFGVMGHRLVAYA